jgi:hypothetical protein
LDIRKKRSNVLKKQKQYEELEYWNDGMMVLEEKRVFDLTQYSTIPIFHYSNGF